MKITTFLFFLCVFSLYAGSGSSQQMLPALDMKNVTLDQVFSVIEKESHFVFLFTDDTEFELKKKVNIRTGDNKTVSEVITQLLKNTELDFLITSRQIAVYKKKSDGKKVEVADIRETQATTQKSIKISGVITDDKGQPLPGVTISLKSNRQVANFSDIDGKFIFMVPSVGESLMFTYIGMQEEEVLIKEGITHYNIKMNPSESQLKEVVVETGMFQRDKVSFTGSAAAYTGTELRNISNQNLIQSLKVLDPSFVVLDNSIRGSDPNTMATIELRGQGGSIINSVKDEFKGDPNLPLFILNGVEVSITRINDLDVNRIESVTVLKDAGTTAIYGSRGANGVIVVETIKPKPGELKVYYNGDFKVEAPDLSVYNMMNASEKLEFERLSGKYTVIGSGPDYALYQKSLMELYNYRLADVERGVDTYWLSEPVQTGLTHGHSVRVSGGSESLSIDAGAKYKNNAGVMKGTKRETWAGNLELAYRAEKLIVSNNLDLSGYNAVNSPYGDFSTWVNTSPYFTKRNEDGGVDKFLQYEQGLGYYSGLGISPITENIPNPLYNALLNSRDDMDNLSIFNTLQIQYTPIEGLRFKVGLDLSREHTKKVVFTPPENTKYHNLSFYEKGEYSNRDAKDMIYKGHIDAIFAKTLKKHSVTLSTRSQIRQRSNDYISTTAVGFPYNSQGTPNLAYSYKENSKPGYYQSKSRGVSFIGNFNYNYDKRYLLDLSLSMDGSSTFGSNELFKSFWSVGGGWNINRESFLKDQLWIEILKIRATTGITGNQNMGDIYSNSVYRYFIDSNVFGQGAYISAFGNPDLPWLVSKDINLGIDFKALYGRLSLTFDVFRKTDDPNIIQVPQIPSTGVDQYPMNLGYLVNNGYEFKLIGYPVYNLSERILWSISVSGTHNKKKYGGLGNMLDSYNEAQRKSNTLAQYIDGYSPDAIWAVRSYGIDPATGEEVFIKKNGDLTFDYDADDMVVVGNKRPQLLGVLSTNFRYKNFEFGMSFSYSFGSDIYNRVLYEKVENITKSSLERNQDKRALYDRWKNPGDISEFKAIQTVTDISPRTSRFVQKNNYLKSESISCRYEIVNNNWLKNNLGVSSLIISGYMNDIFRIETSKTERSIEYPFARSVSLGLNVAF
ncbi:SusC/RagA family TonB-linked outer membrane protein [Dysgonomonas sp. Marseille-P4677]|uniref:SusC/RagA family TonB-linked outer membrane protein n=1 Tax=Dysgonomonas sp. Marseille-P4677 TaxID=2364790 RepID=UPI001914A1A1|nr:SusC/RagA family TonB-linked outer membrane protein [Dysgonomonas sp. Marseille-P4677]MBK5721974.1 SusC/RagA family TonB-linked outer membrane protein [Dysgonomonas sp. Marseille-P4677]